MKEKLYIRLKQLRNQKGLTQAEVADYLNISRQSISQWETGKGYPDIDNIVLLSKLYNMSVDEFLGINEDVITEGEEEQTEVILKETEAENPENNKTDGEPLKLFEIIVSASFTVLLSQIPIVGIAAPIVGWKWLKFVNRKDKLAYLLCSICLINSLYIHFYFWILYF